MSDITEATQPSTLRRAPKRTRGRKRIDVILETAAVLFDEIGYDAVNTILIAKRANTAIGTLYEFFPNKESIADAIVERITFDLKALMDSLVTEDMAIASLDKVLDHIIGPIVEFIHARAGFRALYLKLPHIGQTSAAQQAIEDLFTQRIAAILLLRYPHAPHNDAIRAAHICRETMKALTSLAIASDTIDQAIVADLKLVLRLYLETMFLSSNPA